MTDTSLYSATVELDTLTPAVQRRMMHVATCQRDTSLMTKLASRNDLTADVEQALLSSGKARVLAAWLARPGRPTDQLIAAATDPRVTVRTAVAATPGLPQDVYRATIQDGHIRAVTALCTNEDVSSAVVADALHATVARDLDAVLKAADGATPFDKTVQEHAGVHGQLVEATTTDAQRRAVSGIVGASPALTVDQWQLLVESWSTAKETNGFYPDRGLLSLMVSPYTADRSRQLAVLGPAKQFSALGHRWSSELIKACELLEHGPYEQLLVLLSNYRFTVSDEVRHALDAIAAASDGRALIGTMPLVAATATVAVAAGVGPVADRQAVLALLTHPALTVEAVDRLPKSVTGGGAVHTAVKRRIAGGIGELDATVALVARHTPTWVGKLLSDHPGAADAAVRELGNIAQPHRDTASTSIAHVAGVERMPAAALPAMMQRPALAEQVLDRVAEVCGERPERWDLFDTLVGDYAGSLAELLEDVAGLAD